MKKSLLFTVFAFLATLAFSQTPDPTKIPHYFGPYPNWANSPLTSVDANVQLTDNCGGGQGNGATAVASVNSIGAITGITMTNQGAGYVCAPLVTITSAHGTGAAAHSTFTPSAGFVSSINLVNGGADYFSPTVTITGNGTGATAEATTDPYTGAITGIVLTNPGVGYSNVSVVITDDGGTGSGAIATAVISNARLGIVVDAAGTGYRTPGGLRKFVDALAGLGPSGKNKLGQYVSVAHPDTTKYPGSDYYEIALVQFSQKMHSDLPATRLRGYVQLNYGTDSNGQNTIAPDPPQFLGSTIIARKDRPVRILFKNQLPTGVDGNLFLPVDTTMMGAGMGPDMGGMQESNQESVYDGVRNPMCGMPGLKPTGCYSENRATLHLHGGTTPWISDGTPHQWTAPAGESTMYPKGVSAANVPDMWFDSTGKTIAECVGQTTCATAGATNDPGPGALTFYYTNQQSARLLFYHDHAWGITRLNVYAGEAAGYLITDNTEQALIAPGGPLDASDPALGLGIPLVIQDRTFVPTTQQLAVQDPTWDSARWGSMGDLWYHHVYMPAQNPADPTGTSPYGRWMYGPWFWPPATEATTPYQPIPNPYYNATCDPATDPNGFCEPPMIPGTPNISVGMEQFNDTPLVNGTAYPTLTLDPKAYRFRLLNAANDRFFNLQWYVADSTGTEVALNASEVAAAQLDPNVFPTPDTTISPAGPNWIQIGTEGGFLPTPVVVPNQPITWITDPTRFDFGNVDQHAMLIAPAERADVIVDFSKFAGKTLILYNDAPAAFPARVASYDYYTGDPDNTDIGGAPSTIPGFGPNTRTIMQIKVNSGTSSPSAFSLNKLVSAFQHNAYGTGVFESGQHPIIVGQAAYNRAYGTSFTTSGDCTLPTTTHKCDGYARISQQGGDLFTFDALSGNKISIPLQPKALHDEMNSATFDEYGRMTANLGVEAVPANPAAQNIILYPYVNPATEMIDATNLPSAGGMQITPISSAADGTQIWKITHNGVDTHPIHFHLYDVQLINRVTWDNIIIPPDPNELGWKDTIRTSPLEDTYVALRPVVPTLPFQIPNSIRPLNPMMPLGSTMGFSSIGLDGQATTSTITNDLVNFGWEYVWHCHILSHEEMDMMRPVSLAVPPPPPTNLVATMNGGAVQLTWTNTAANATSYTVQRATNIGFTEDLVSWPVGIVNNYTDSSTTARTAYYYRVFASNTVGSTQDSGFTQSAGGGSMPMMTVNSGFSNTASDLPTDPVAVLSQTTVDFGNVLLKTTAGPITLTLSNLGAPPMTISGIALGGRNPSQFALPVSGSPCGATLNGGASCSIDVTFSPTAMGARSALLILTTNDPAVPVIQVTLTGSGIANTSMNMNAPGISFGEDGVVNVTLSSTQIAPVVGSVTLSVDGGAPLAQALVNGSTAFVLTAPTAGTHTLAADFAAQGGFSASSATGTLVVTSTALTITASNATTTFGAPLPTITPTYSGFMFGQGPANLTGTVSCTTNATTLSPVSGNPYVTSCSGATSTNYSITYQPGTLTVQRASTATTITSSTPNPSIRGQIITVNFTVAPQYTGTPTGSVTVTASTGETCSAALAAGNCNLTFLASGPRTISAAYIGDPNFVGSTSPAINQMVNGVSLSTTSLLYGNQIVGTTSSVQSVTFVNLGTNSLTMSAPTFGGAFPGDFKQTNTCGTSVGAGRSCRYDVTFSPTAPGVRGATLFINNSDQTSPQTVSLVGTGVQPGVSLTPATYDFGSVMVGQTSPYGFILTNTGNAPLTISSVSLGGVNPAQFRQSNNCGTTVNIGQSCTITVTFAPTTVFATMSATLNVTDNASPTVQTVSLKGAGVQPTVSLTPATHDFGNVVVGQTSQYGFTLTNTGTAPLTISGLSFTGTNATQFKQTNNCGTTVNIGLSCTITVTFAPTRSGPLSATLNLSDNAPSRVQTVLLTGTGLQPAVSLTPATYNFGNVMVGQTSAYGFTLTNTGTAPLAITSVALGGVNPAQFKQSNNCGTTVNIGQSCTITVTFAPTTVFATMSATLNVTDNAAPTVQTVSLTGAGVQPRVSLTPGTYNFGNVTVGQTSSYGFILANTGTAPLTISGISLGGTNPVQYKQSNNCGTTVNIGQSCTITVTFAPTKTGPLSATFSVTDDAASKVQTVTLAGTGQ